MSWRVSNSGTLEFRLRPRAWSSFPVAEQTTRLYGRWSIRKRAKIRTCLNACGGRNAQREDPARGPGEKNEHVRGKHEDASRPREALDRGPDVQRSSRLFLTVRTNICATNIVVFTMFMKTITLATFATGAMARSRTLSSTRSAIHNDGRRWFPLARPRLPVPCAVSHSLCLIYGCF